jgi:EAL domain-containing protein (putative c-di-GMP-specific phosphodiesterase class I)
MHQRRVQRMLFVSSAVAIVVGVGWGLVFAVRGIWFVVAFDIAITALGGTIALLTHRGHTRLASRLLVAAAYLVLCVNELVFDLPSPGIPRSGHDFLLALGLIASLLMREERAWLRHGAPLLCFATFVVFAAGGAQVGWATPYALPDSVRESGQWVNHAVAMLTLYLVLHVILNDVAERHTLERELRDALVRGELLLHFQPQVAEGGRVTGAEALLRWQHPQRGMVPPAEFIPLAERTGLMLPLGDWVLKRACEQLAAWRQRPETAALTLAVNVSALQLAQDDFVAKVQAGVAQAGIDPSRLKLELTESMLAHDLEDIIAKMTALKAHGIGFSLDDFGTGFSSLSYLRRLPLDQLKIDQSFVAGMLDSPKEAAIVQALISLGTSLGIELIAEGVETEAQRRFLQERGCKVYQGYLFSRPVPAAGFEALLARAEGSPRAVQAAARAIGSAA